MSGLSLPAVPAAAPVPAGVRAGGKDAEDTYRAALGFERMLVGELTRAMSSSSARDAETGAPAASPHAEMLSGALADAVTGAGGIGLAQDLYLALREQA